MEFAMAKSLPSILAAFIAYTIAEPLLPMILKPEGLTDPHGLSRKNTDKPDPIGTKHLPKNA
jgi:hypothetical protein